MRRLGQLRMVSSFRHPQGMRALATALEVPPEDSQGCRGHAAQLEQACKRSEEQEWREWCSRFQPHAILTTDQPRPSPIFVAAILGPERILRLDFELGRPPVTWPFQVSERLPDRVPAFGKVMGFYLNYSPERAVEFDGAGRAWIEHKGRDITPAWRAATHIPQKT